MTLPSLASLVNRLLVSEVHMIVITTSMSVVTVSAFTHTHIIKIKELDLQIVTQKYRTVVSNNLLMCIFITDVCVGFCLVVTVFNSDAFLNFELCIFFVITAHK